MFDSFMLDGVQPAMFWISVSLAVLIQGISKSGFGGGVGIISVPLMVLVMPVDKAVAAMLPLLILCDMNAIYHHRRNKVWKPILRIYIPSIAGILAGAYCWWRIGPESVEAYKGAIRQFVGGIAILFALYILFKEFALDWIAKFKPGVRTGLAAGIAAGFTSTLAHAAGPIVSLYIFAQGMGKTLFVGSVAWTFTLINLTKLPFYVSVGLIKKDVLLFGLTLVWLIPIGSFLGHWMHHRVAERPFNRIILVFTLLTSIKLIFDVNVAGLAVNWLLG